MLGAIARARKLRFRPQNSGQPAATTGFMARPGQEIYGRDCPSLPQNQLAGHHREYIRGAMGLLLWFGFVTTWPGVLMQGGAPGPCTWQMQVVLLWSCFAGGSAPTLQSQPTEPTTIAIRGHPPGDASPTSTHQHPPGGGGGPQPRQRRLQPRPQSPPRWPAAWRRHAWLSGGCRHRCSCCSAGWAAAALPPAAAAAAAAVGSWGGRPAALQLRGRRPAAAVGCWGEPAALQQRGRSVRRVVLRPPTYWQAVPPPPPPQQQPCHCCCRRSQPLI